MRSHPTRKPAARAALVLCALAATGPLRAGFAGTDVFVPAVARIDGQQGARFFSTLWLTNAGDAPITYRLAYFLANTSNTSPALVSGELGPGETRRIDDVVGTAFDQPGTSGAIRITSSGEILASSRTYSLPAGGRADESSGLFFAAVPASFAIGLGESAQLQGVSQNAAENFRYNFGYVETTGNSARVRFVARGANGVALGVLEDDVQAYARRQYSALDVAPSIATANARIEATVIAGSGRVLVYGTQIANASNDSSGFEMSFRPAGVAAMAAGVTALNGLSGNVQLVAGANTTITASGNALTIAATGGTTGLSLPYTGTASIAGPALSVSNSGAGGTGIAGFSNALNVQGIGVYGGTQGLDLSIGVSGEAIGPGQIFGVQGRTTSGQQDAAGVHGVTTAATGNAGRFQNSAANVVTYLATRIGTTDYGLYTADTVRGGSLQIVGAKMFVTPHPEDASKEIDYVAAEGPSADVYFRGSGRLSGGVARIAIPDHFRLVAREGSYMTTLTPVGRAALLLVESEGADGIVVKGDADVAFHYVVWAERDALAGHQTVAPNVNFRPEAIERAGGVARLPERVRAALVKNGTLNPDGTYNEAKAEALGWNVPRNR
ncbi:MAG: hypothetical protein JNK60_16330 [Acidobacteria bacterium]|nr:hypothetical protein [Acidobacteriota bacterium]